MSCLEVPINEASSNVALTCKRYYVEAILKEIGITEHRNKSYYKAKRHRKRKSTTDYVLDF